MGQSQSSQKENAEQQERRELEGVCPNLPLLQKAFKNMSATSEDFVPTQTLQQCLHCHFSKLEGGSKEACEELFLLLENVSPLVVSIYFVAQDEQVSWVEFLKGYAKCCKLSPASHPLKLLFRLFHETRIKAEVPSNLEFVDYENDSKVSGKVNEHDIYVFLWFCWLLESPFYDSITIELPEIKHLVNSAHLACSVSRTEDNSNLSNEDLSSDFEMPVESFLSWILTDIPCLAYSFQKYINSALQQAASNTEDPLIESSSKEQCSSSTETSQSGLLTHGVAWAIALSSNIVVGKQAELLWSASHSNVVPDLLYRSSEHGSGLNRFWSHVEGYQGSLLIILKGTVKEELHNGVSCENLVIGALTSERLENKDSFYGKYAVLYAINPTFHTFLPTGKEKNFVYSHLHGLGRAYDPNKRCVGIAFGGSEGNERVFIDEDFAKVTLRHHAVDKTYHPGSLFPGQPYLPVEASVVEVEAWGLGGKVAAKQQEAFKQRENLFSEQRRKVDLKTFINWEDSPEKMMMDLMSNPQKVERERR